MTQRIEAIDSLRLAEAFAQSHKPFDECWSVRMDSELLVIDDDDEHATRFSTNQDEAGRALKAVCQLKETIQLFVEKLTPLDVNLLCNREVYCHIVVSERFPRSRATRQDYCLQFFDETEVELSFSEKLYWNKFD